MGLFSRTPAVPLGRKLVPWLVLLEVLRHGYAHWQEQLTPEERHRLTELLVASRGRPGALSPRERDEVQALTSKLDIVALGKRVALGASGFGGLGGGKG
jgi:hypothetical protein